VERIVEAEIECVDCRETFTIRARSDRDLLTCLAISHRCSCCAVGEYIERLAAFALKPKVKYDDGYGIV
jgi:hypothetical protein